jgi:hypothetical protein
MGQAATPQSSIAVLSAAAPRSGGCGELGRALLIPIGQKPREEPSGVIKGVCRGDGAHPDTKAQFLYGQAMLRHNLIINL